MCTNIDKEGSSGGEKEIDRETNEMHKGHEILIMISVLVLSSCITLRNFF